MGDFDRNPTSSAKKEQKKIIVLAVLGVVLLGVGFYHFKKGSPQAAIAAPGAPETLTPASAGTPEQVIAALRQNPLKNMTQGSQAGAVPAGTPRNPFQMSEELRREVRPVIHELNTVPVPIPVNNNVPPVIVTVPTPVRNIPTLKVEAYKVSSIIRTTTLFAVINGTIAQEGAVIGEARVVAIGEQSVTLRHVNAPADGPTIEVFMKRRLND